MRQTSSDREIRRFFAFGRGSPVGKAATAPAEGEAARAEGEVEERSWRRSVPQRMGGAIGFATRFLAWRAGLGSCVGPYLKLKPSIPMTLVYVQPPGNGINGLFFAGPVANRATRGHGPARERRLLIMQKVNCTPQTLNPT